MDYSQCQPPRKDAVSFITKKNFIFTYLQAEKTWTSKRYKCYISAEHKNRECLKYLKSTDIYNSINFSRYPYYSRDYVADLLESLTDKIIVDGNFVPTLLNELIGTLN